MRDKAEKSIQALTDVKRAGQHTLTQLLRSVEGYAVLEAQIQGQLSSRLKDQLRVVRIDQNTLIVAVPSSAWVSRAHLEAEQILRIARNHWGNPLSDIKVIVNPA